MTTLIEEFGTTQLLDDMNTYWNSNDETNEAFWEHEWASHGTCVTTLDPSCYTNYQTGMEAVDFFQITVNLFKTLVCAIRRADEELSKQPLLFGIPHCLAV